MQKEFFAVFVKSSYHVEGDDRSRTNPGHGYPAHSVEYTEVKEFQTESELKTWILKNNDSYSPKEFCAVKCFPLSVNTNVEIKIESAPNKPEIGDAAECKICDGSIQFDGRVWFHTLGNLRHPASPRGG